MSSLCRESPMRDFHEGSSLMRSPGIRVPALLQERLQPRAFAPSPAQAGEDWGGVPFGSFHTVGTPTQPPPAFAGGGDQTTARGVTRTAMSSQGNSYFQPHHRRSQAS